MLDTIWEFITDFGRGIGLAIFFGVLGLLGFLYETWYQTNYLYAYGITIEHLRTMNFWWLLMEEGPLLGAWLIFVVPWISFPLMVFLPAIFGFVLGVWWD